ncbi:MAG: glucosaminidase domain-containing protein [Gammaproteobacteria bacterium]|nr:glucosaminidase domain-containing protein [Gammaproteobacteria bacterium]
MKEAAVLRLSAAGDRAPQRLGAGGAAVPAPGAGSWMMREGADADGRGAGDRRRSGRALSGQGGRDDRAPREIEQDRLRRADEIPPSLVLAQAAAESAWGTSRFARMANNLFGQPRFTEGCGRWSGSAAPRGRHPTR